VSRAYSFAARLRCVACNAAATEVALELVDEGPRWRCEDAAACRRRTEQQLRLFEAAA
jgi:hypothetical protein